MKINFTVVALIICFTSFTQDVILETNGNRLQFKKIDTLFYCEYSESSLTAKNAIKDDPFTVKLPTSFGIIKKEQKESVDQPTFKTNFYVYTDGTLEAPTSQLFFQPKNIAAFRTAYDGIGDITEHEWLKGYYFLNVKNKNYSKGDSIFTLCQKIFKEGKVNLIEPVLIKLIKSQNPLRPFQWNIRNNANIQGGIQGADMNVENAWCNSTGTNIRVAVIDDGVDLTHPDLQQNLLPGFDATGNNSGGASNADNGHGTNCAGIIASIDNTIGTIGVAFNARIIPIRLGIVNVANNSFNTNSTWMANCFVEAVNRGADIISNSWGGGSPSAQVNVAITNAVNNGRLGRGCIVLFSTGNLNSTLFWPSSNENVIAVGASTPCDTRKRSSNNPLLLPPDVVPDAEGTSCDGEDWWGSNFGGGLDVLAPGVLITTTDNVGTNGLVGGDYNFGFNGTSAACPNAAAVVAIILSVNPMLTGIQARNILEQTCFKIPNGNFQPNIPGQPNGTWSAQAGYGRIDAAAAVNRSLQLGRMITGNSLICNTSNYFIADLPAGSEVTWSIPQSAGSVLQLNPISQNMLSITNQKWYGIATTLTATISNTNCNGNDDIILVRSIANDNSTSAPQPYAYTQEACTFFNVPHPSQNGTVFSNSSPVFVHQGCMVYVNLGNMFGRTVSLGTSSVNPLIWGVGPTSFYQNTLYFKLPLGSGGIPFTFNINGDGACFQRSLLFFSYSGNARYAFAASPNPVIDQLVITAKEDEKYLSEHKLVSNKQTMQFTMNVYDLNTNTLQLSQRSTTGNMQHTLNLSKLKKGYYILQIVTGNDNQTIKFLKE